MQTELSWETYGAYLSISILQKLMNSAGKGYNTCQILHLHRCGASHIRMMCGQCCKVFAKNGFVTPRITGGGAWAFVVYSLNSLSWMVKYGRKSEQYIKGVIVLEKKNIYIYTSVLYRWSLAFSNERFSYVVRLGCLVRNYTVQSYY